MEIHEKICKYIFNYYLKNSEAEALVNYLSTNLFGNEFSKSYKKIIYEQR